MSRIWLSPPHVGPEERRMLLDAFDSNWIAPLGPHVDGFEAELAARAGVGHCAALSSGTAGLHLALVLLGIGPGDTVLTSTLTFAATANAIVYVGAEPVFVDAHPDTWTLHPELLAAELDRLAASGELPKAVIAVDLYGQCCDYEKIEASCAKHGVHLIEDAAESLGASAYGRPAGSFGRIGVFSFNGNKIITTSGGGALVSAEPELVSRTRFLATQARDPAPHYEHSTIGYNYRLSNLLAALGRAQLAKLDERIRRRRAVRDRYADALGSQPGVELMPLAPYGESNCWLTCLTIDAARFGADREAVRLHLAADEIEARPVWKPMHLQPVFRERRAVLDGTSDHLFAQGLCLPSGSSLSDADVERVIAAFLSTPRS
ncbi:MAG: dTDP-4-amino-4,6-dideoxygalactose transaminase [Myxococcota bacterium]|jgi:dTDP-4-amino-4,6-dideoxygalactose transaminase